MEATRDRYNLNLLAKLMVLLRQILFNLAVAAVAEAILVPITSGRMSFLYRVASKYLELVTSSNFWPFMLIICTDVARAVGRDLALFCADFHSIRTRSFYESFSKVLNFTIAAAYIVGCILALHQWRWKCGGHGMFPA